MPKQGFQVITLRDKVIADIDSLIDKNNPEMNKRSRVIEMALLSLRTRSQH